MNSACFFACVQPAAPYNDCMLKLYHATPARNLPSILKRGLLKRKATGKRKAVWAVPVSGIPWACMHVAWKHKCPITEVVVLEFTVPAEQVRFMPQQLGYIERDVPPESFGTIQTFALVARTGGVDGRATRRGS